MTVVEFLFRSMQFSVVATALLAVILIFPVIKVFANNGRVPPSEAMIVEMELVSFISFVGLLVAISFLTFVPQLVEEPNAGAMFTLGTISPTASIAGLALFYLVMIGASVRARRLRNALARNPSVRAIRLDQKEDRKWFWVKLILIFFTGLLLTSIELYVV